jgi:hypothetical protein
VAARLWFAYQPWRVFYLLRKEKRIQADKVGEQTKACSLNRKQDIND